MQRLTRYLTLALAAAQFALPAVASVADGLSAMHGRNEASHVEDIAQKQCKPPHSADCAVCRFLSSTNSKGSNSSQTVFAAVDVTSPATASAVPNAEGLHVGLNSRAPPATLV